MNQKVTYDLIAELGGTASRKQILALAEQKYRGKLYADKLINGALKRLHHWGYISHNMNTHIYTILEPFPESNIYHTKIEESE